MSINPVTHIKKRVPRNVRNWIKSPRRTSMWLWDEVCHVLGANPSLLIRPEWPLRCHPAAYRFAQHEQMDDPEQRKEFDAFIQSIVPGTILVDVGAHFGIFSLAALHYGGPTAQAIAVDASPFATRVIETQARLNRTGPSKLEVVTAMVGDHVGEGEMVSVGVIAGGYFVVPSSTHSSADRSRIRMTTVDELSRCYNVTPSHVKIDVEGYEASVLRGAIKTLSDHSPTLFLELHHAMIRQAGGNPRDTIELLEQHNYRLFSADGHLVPAKVALSHDIVRVIARKVP